MLILFVLSINTIMMEVPQVRAQAVVDVTYGSTPTVDGSISAGEYADANSLTFATSGGNCTVYFKHNGSSLHVAFDVPNVDFGSSVQIFVDTNYDQASLPQTDDYRFTIKLDGLMAENQGTGTGWNPTVWDSAVGWTGARQQFASTWNAEFAIPYAKLGITAGVAKTIGISFWNAWTSTGDYRWPTGADWVTPSTWGAASSSDNWAPPEMFWKANFIDYAPSGVPDFDQRQAGWQDPFGQWTWCVPAAVANSLWWMDSRYETSTTPPPTINDTFPLVSPYGPWDDHDPNNVVPFIEHLAYLMDTEGVRTGIAHTGTNVFDMQAGIAQYLSWTGLNPQGDLNGDGVVNQTDYDIIADAYVTIPGDPSWDMRADIYPSTVGWPVPGIADNVVNALDFWWFAGGWGQIGMFYEQTVPGPDFYYVEEEVERSEDVILLLGFYEPIDGWIRINQSESEYPLYPYGSGHAVTVAGVNSTTLQIAISDPIQDNAEPPPQGTNGTGRVLPPPPPPHPHPPAPPYPLHNNATYVSHDVYNVTWAPPGLPVPANFSLIDYSSPQYVPGLIAVVEWAVIVSPIEVPPPPEMYWKANYTDYAPSGVPDFDQNQILVSPRWCTPTAVADSLWWMDSRYENSTTPPPTINDTFPLVSPYGPWDDHDPNNVMPFIQHLAWLMDTDGNRTGILQPRGTWTRDMETGIAQYLSWSGVNPLGDVNGDGIVDMTDWHHVNAVINGTKPFDISADIWPETVTGPYTADNVVNASDLALVTANMNSTGMFYEKTIDKPGFIQIAAEVEKSEDVILVLGFWRYNETTEEWTRAYDTPYEESGLGHAVTVAGINSTELKIAISDPGIDAFEAGLTPGRSPVPHIHVPPGTHNNAALVSHDIYNVTFVFGNPGGTWALQGYGGVPGAPPGTIAVVEAAVIVSPVSDVAVISVVPAENQAYPTWAIPLNITVTVLNNGTEPANFTVTAYYNDTLIETLSVTNLAASAEMNLTFSWNLTDVALGLYPIKANATLDGDTNPNNDEFVDGTVKVKLTGDIDGDADVDGDDFIMFAGVYPSSPTINPQADLDGDNDVDGDDFVMFAGNYPQSTTAYPPDP